MLKIAEEFNGNLFTIERVTFVITPGILELEVMDALLNEAASVVVTMTEER